MSSWMSQNTPAPAPLGQSSIQALYPPIPQQPNQPFNSYQQPSSQQLQPFHPPPSQFSHTAAVQQYGPGPSTSQVQTYQGGQGQTQPYQNYGYVKQSVLQPQPVIELQNEDPVYGPLGRARSKVERALRGDEEVSPDLADAIVQTGGLATELYVDPVTPAHAPFRVIRTTPLPDALHQELNYKNVSAKMGLFEAIERAWFTVDNKLFLWDYNDGRDFSRYDEQPENIQAVGLVTARKDVFIDQITHILLIATATRVTLLGLAFNSSTPRQLELFYTNFSAELPSPVTYIAGTPSGRIFMLGADKDIYEVEYSNSPGMFWGSGAKVSIRNCTNSKKNYVPSFLSWAGKEGVAKIALDSLSSRLWTLRTTGEIELYDVTPGRFELRRTYHGLGTLLVEQGIVQQASQPGAKIVSICPISLRHSSRFGLVAITANGARIFFDIAPAANARPAVRLPTVMNQALNDTSLYSSQIFIAAQSDNSPTPATRLHVFVPPPGRLTAPRENSDRLESGPHQEMRAEELIPSDVWAIAEVPIPAHPYLLVPNTNRLLSALPRQLNVEPQQFLILATSGLYFATVPRPLDMLTAELEADKDRAIANALQSFGKIQLATMGLALGATSDMKNQDVASTVGQIITFSTPPVINTGTAGRTIIYSARHEGLALIIARYLRPIWGQAITRLIVGRQLLAVSEAVLLDVQGKLEQLRRYLDENPFPRVHAEGDAKLAWEQEDISIASLEMLIKLAIEGISFVLLLNDYKLSEVVARCDPQVQSTLAGLTYQSLLTETLGRDVAKRLLNALIELQIGQELSIDTLSEILQQRCGSFCQPGDVVMYKAEESLRRAEGTRDASERQASLNESLRLFAKAASNLAESGNKLKDITSRYRSLHFTPGAIGLVLRCASDLDPEDRASDYVNDGRHPNDPRKAAYDRRLEQYADVTEMLGLYDDVFNKASSTGINLEQAARERDEAYLIVLGSRDKLFHYYFYDWLVATGKQETLLDLDTDFVEAYLIETPSSDPERRDLLWKYYNRREEFLKSAHALHDLATRPGALPLSFRSYYLSQALNSMRSAASIGTDDVELTSQLSERIEVAQVQAEILRAIAGHPDIPASEKAEVQNRLGTDLVGLDDLYQNFARPFRLLEQILMILKTADTRIDDVCDAVWRALLVGAQEAGQDTPARAMSDTVVDLLRKYYPSEAAPADVVLPVVYSIAVRLLGESELGWASRSLLDGGLGVGECWDVVTQLYEAADSEEERQFFAEEAGVIIERWTSKREGIPPADIERFASAWILRTGDTDGDERKRITKERMRRGKHAAGW